MSEQDNQDRDPQESDHETEQATQSTTPSKPTVTLDPSRPRDEFRQELLERLKHADRVYCYGGQLYDAWSGGIGPIHKSNYLSELVGDLLYIVKVDRKGNPSHVALPKSDAQFLLDSPELKDKLPQLAFISRVPCLDEDSDITLPGFNAKGLLYYDGPRIDSSSTATHLPRLLDAMPFKRDVDRVNYLGFLLTPFVRYRLRGQLMIGLLKGNQPGIGKTTSAQVAGVLATNAGTVSMQTFKTDDGEFEKCIATQVARGSQFIIIDNVRLPANKVIQSPILEELVTAPDYHFRRIATSTAIQGPNHLQFWITYNGGTIGQDLASRCVPIMMEYRGDPLQRPVPPIGDLLKYARDHRHELIAELLGLWDTWRRAGGEQVDVACRSPAWARLINGVLRANNYSGFLSTLSDDHGEFDEVQIGLEQLASDEPDAFRSPGEWRATAERIEAFVSALQGHQHRSKDTRMGSILSSYVGRSVRIVAADGSSRRGRLTVRQAQNGREYAFTSREPHADAPPAE